MDRKNILKFSLKMAMIFSILLGPLYSVISFIFTQIPEFYYSWDLTGVIMADYTSISFIMFFIVFLITFKFMERITNTLSVILSFLASGFILIYIALSWTLDVYLILMLISGPLFGFTIPVIFKYTTKNIFPKQESRINRLTTLGVLVVFLLFSFIIFYFVGVLYWRLIYIITGILILISTFFIAKMKTTEEVKI